MTKKHHRSCAAINKRTGRKHVKVKGHGCVTKRQARKIRARRKHHHRR